MYIIYIHMPYTSERSTLNTQHLHPTRPTRNTKHDTPTPYTLKTKHDALNTGRFPLNPCGKGPCLPNRAESLRLNPPPLAVAAAAARERERETETERQTEIETDPSPEPWTPQRPWILLLMAQPPTSPHMACSIISQNVLMNYS